MFVSSINVLWSPAEWHFDNGDLPIIRGPSARPEHVGHMARFPNPSTQRNYSAAGDPCVSRRMHYSFSTDNPSVDTSRLLTSQKMSPSLGQEVGPTHWMNELSGKDSLKGSWGPDGWHYISLKTTRVMEISHVTGVQVVFSSSHVLIISEESVRSVFPLSLHRSMLEIVDNKGDNKNCFLWLPSNRGLQPIKTKKHIKLLYI